ncbi:hypothetical protein C348_06149 [Cryptococcus neoformans Gb118]|nr:hypothetical protein C348_06149 [Cryptococcus neoformans var. grubii Gb118]
MSRRKRRGWGGAAEVRLRIQVRPEVGVVGKLAGEFLDQNFMAVNRASKRARRRMTVGARLVAMANLMAVITAVFLGENLTNIFSSQGAVIRERSFGIMVVTDQVAAFESHATTQFVCPLRLHMRVEAVRASCAVD